MDRSEELIGKRFGELTVIAKLPKDKTYERVRYECVCSCGKHLIRTRKNLRSNSGCDECRNKKYGAGIRTRYYRLYRIWISMRMRCSNTTDANYKNYGKRGIEVCKEWEDFNNFRNWAYSAGYSDDATRNECTLDRIDVNKSYCPENCRWTNSGIQALNKRKVKNKSGARGIWITRNGKYNAVISVKNKRHCLGTYTNIEDAIEARHNAEIKYFGITVEA